MDDKLMYNKLVKEVEGKDGQPKLVALVDIPKSCRPISCS